METGPWDTQSSGNTKGTVPMDLNSKGFRHCHSKGEEERGPTRKTTHDLHMTNI